MAGSEQLEQPIHSEAGFLADKVELKPRLQPGIEPESFEQWPVYDTATLDAPATVPPLLALRRLRRWLESCAFTCPPRRHPFIRPVFPIPKGALIR